MKQKQHLPIEKKYFVFRVATSKCNHFYLQNEKGYTRKEVRVLLHNQEGVVVNGH